MPKEVVMIFIIPEILIVLLLIGITYLPAPAVWSIIGYIIFCLVAHRHWVTIISAIQKIITKIKFWRRKENG